MATHSSILAWRIPRTEEPGGLQSIGSPVLAGRFFTSSATWETQLILNQWLVNLIIDGTCVQAKLPQLCLFETCGL